jgi:hypothetical protein
VAGPERTPPDEGEGDAPGHERAVARWHAEIDAMFARMQTPEFAAAVARILDEPMRVPVPEHLRGPARPEGGDKHAT